MRGKCGLMQWHHKFLLVIATSLLNEHNDDGKSCGSSRDGKQNKIMDEERDKSLESHAMYFLHRKDQDGSLS